MPQDAPRRRRRRAQGPPGAPSGPEPDLGLRADEPDPGRPDDAERYVRERPPHHDQGV